MSKITNPIVVRRGMHIGKVAAEADDEYLFDCFVKTHAYQALVDPDSPVMIVNGRTGSGKTALLRYIENSEEACRSIDPFEISMKYVANSDILRFLNDIGADLDLLFQLLWKHVLCLEFIRMRFGVQNETKSKSFFDRLTDLFVNDSRKRDAIRYLEKYRDKFWVEMDRNVQELIENYERDISAELGGEIRKIKAKANYAKQLSETRKSEIISRVKKIIDGEQHSQLAKVMDLLKDPKINDGMRCHYILLDQLDQNWVDDSVRFRLIGALVETLKKFRKIKNLKIIVALRTDVIERVAIENPHPGSQREKLDDYSVRLTWNKADLREMVERRISLLFKKKYSGEVVSFSDLFKRKLGNEEPFEYLLERSHMRPRDILSFVNQCLLEAVDKNEVSAGSIKAAEKEYSRIRYQALCQEWASVYPCLPTILEASGIYLHGKKFGEIPTREVWEFMILRILEDKSPRDPIRQKAERAANESTPREILEFGREVASLLYRVGALCIKSSADDRYKLSDRDSPLVAPSSIQVDAKFRIHPMLMRELGIDSSRRDT